MFAQEDSTRTTFALSSIEQSSARRKLELIDQPIARFLTNLATQSICIVSSLKLVCYFVIEF